MLKQIGLILFSFVLTVTASEGQPLRKEEAAGFAESLFKNNILNAAGRDELIRLIKKDELRFDPNFGAIPCGRPETSKASVLQFCHHSFIRETLYRLEVKFRPSLPFRRKKHRRGTLIPGGNILEQSITGPDSVIVSMFSMPLSFPHSYKIETYIHPSKSVFGKTRSQTAIDLLNTGIIDSSTYQEIQDALAVPSIGMESHVCEFASWTSKFRERYPERKKRQIMFLDSLEHVGILEKGKKDSLINVWLPFTFLDPVDVLACCDRAVTFIAKPSDDPNVVYKQLFSQIKTLIPDFNFSKVEHRLDTVQNPNEWYIERYMTINLQTGEKLFEHRFLFDRERDMANFQYPQRNGLIQSNFFDILNLWLEENHYDERFYRFDDNSLRAERCGLILLNTRQYETWDANEFFPDQDKL